MTLTVSEVSASYRRGQHVVDGVSLEVAPGEFALILGHNGAGKTTLLNTIYGIHRPDSGEVLLEGVALPANPSSRVAGGIAFVPSEQAIFPSLSCRENLQLSVSVVPGAGRQERAELIAEAVQWFPVLEEKMAARAGSLSGGQRRMLAVAMALTQRPRYLLMDEPSLGLAPQIVDELFDKLTELRANLGVATVVVEQTASTTFLKADQIHVIRGGRQAFSGDYEAFAQHDLWELL